MGRGELRQAKLKLLQQKRVFGKHGRGFPGREGRALNDATQRPIQVNESAYTGTLRADPG